MREWVPGWVARGWRRKGGAVENLELWQKLVQATASHDVTWTWVRGHAGHAKNEYANHLATRAALAMPARAAIFFCGSEPGCTTPQDMISVAASSVLISTSMILLLGT